MMCGDVAMPLMGDIRADIGELRSSKKCGGSAGESASSRLFVAFRRRRDGMGEAGHMAGSPTKVLAGAIVF